MCAALCAARTLPFRHHNSARTVGALGRAVVGRRVVAAARIDRVVLLQQTPSGRARRVSRYVSRSLRPVLKILFASGRAHAVRGAL